MLELATDLRSSGVDVILDKWDLKEGQDSIAFMEKMVTDPNIRKVLLICDTAYAEKADKRSGGVGTEAQIISPKIYTEADQTKFVAVVRERDAEGRARVPTYYVGRIHIDLSSEDGYAQNFEQLVRWIFDKPVNIKPPIGSAPTYVTKPTTILTLGNAAAQHRAVDALRSGKPHASGALDEYLTSCASGMEQFRIRAESNVNFDDEIVASIESFTVPRNDLIEIFILIARYGGDDEFRKIVHRFFERLIALFDAPPQMTSYGNWDFDNYQFVVHELFLYLIAALLRSERFGFVSSILSQPYYVRSARGPAKSDTFVIIRRHMQSLEGRSQRLKLNRASLRADMLKERCMGVPIEFGDLMQADFVLYIRSSIDAINGEESQWWPETLLYAPEYMGPSESFARSESGEYFGKLRAVLGVKDKADLGRFFDGVASKKIYTPHWSHRSLQPSRLMAFDKLASRA